MLNPQNVFLNNIYFLIHCYTGVRVKKYFEPNLISTNCCAAKQLPQFLSYYRQIARIV